MNILNGIRNFFQSSTLAAASASCIMPEDNRQPRLSGAEVRAAAWEEQAALIRERFATSITNYRY